MDDATLVVPLVFAVELDGIAHFWSCDARREVDAARDKQRPAARHFQDKALMSAAVIVVGQDAEDGVAAAGSLAISRCNEGVGRGLAICSVGVNATEGRSCSVHANQASASSSLFMEFGLRRKGRNS